MNNDWGESFVSFLACLAWVIESLAVALFNESTAGNQLIVCQCSHVRFICGSWGCAIRLRTTEQCSNERVLTCTTSASRIFRIIEMFASNRFRNSPRAQNFINLNSCSRRSTNYKVLFIVAASDRNDDGERESWPIGEVLRVGSLHSAVALFYVARDARAWIGAKVFKTNINC